MTEKITTVDEMLRHIGTLADEMKAKVYIVGGFVRDQIIGRTVKDIDFTVIKRGMRFARAVADSLNTPDIVCFERFGTCKIGYGDFHLEFVQARAESYESHSRKPLVEEGNLSTDLARRDFTVNTLARRLTADGPGELIDQFNGLRDLEKGVLRTPLDPDRTFDDDPLRMVRAVRFAARLGFRIDRKTMNAVRKNRERILIVSQERITHEFIKIMQTPKPSVGLDLLRKTGLLELLFPDLHQLIGIDQRGNYHHKDVWFHTIRVVDNIAAVSDKVELRLAALYHDIAKPQTKRFVEEGGWTFHGHDALGAKMISRIVKRLKLPSAYIPYLQKLTYLHLRPINLSNEEVTDSAIRRLIAQAGNELEDLLILCRADITSGNPRRVKRHLKNFDRVERRIQEVEDLDALRAFKSPVNGYEIMETFNLKPGPLVGSIKFRIEEAILDGIIPNDHNAAFEYMLSIKNDLFREPENKETRSGNN